MVDETHTDISRTTGTVRALAWLPLIAMITFWVVQLPDFGRLQYNDYYELLPQLADNDGHYTRNPLDYLSLKSNEHTVAIPAVIYVVNAKLTGGDNRGLSAVSLLFMSISFFLIYLWTPERWRRHPASKAAVVTVLAVFVLTPVAAHNVVKGFSGTIWLLANALALGAMTVLAGLNRDARLRKLWPVLALGVLGALSYSTTLSLWPALIVGAVFLGLDRRHLTGIAIAGLVLIAIYFGSVHTPENHPGADVSHTLRLVQYLGIYLGNVIAGCTGRAMVAGLVGLMLFGVAVTWAAMSGSDTRQQTTPWIMLGIYAVGNGLGTAVTRAGFGPEQALASRYATLSAFLWLSILAIASLKAAEVEGAPPRRRSIIAVAAVALALAGISLSHGVERLRAHVRAARHQPVAELAFQYGIWDDAALRWISPDPGGPIRAIPFLRRNGHIPFDRPIESFLGQPLPSKGRVSGHGDDLVGSLDSVTPIKDDVSRIEGWAYRPGATVRRLVAVDSEGIVRGEARIGVLREKVAAVHGQAAQRSGFMGWVMATDPTLEMRVYVQFSDDDSFYPVGRVFRLDG